MVPIHLNAKHYKNKISQTNLHKLKSTCEYYYIAN